MRTLKVMSHVGVVLSALVIIGLCAFSPSDSYDSAAQLIVAGVIMLIVGLLGLGMRIGAGDDQIFVGRVRVFFTVCGGVVGGYMATHTDYAWNSEPRRPMAPTDQLVTYLEAGCLLVFAMWGVFNMLLDSDAQRARDARTEQVPVSVEVDTRIRRSGGTVAFLRWGLALPAVAATIPLALTGSAELVLPLLFLPCLLALICAVYFGRRRNRPWRWAGSAKLAGGAAGVQTGMALGALAGTPAWSMLLAVVGGGSLGAVGCAWIAARGRDKILVPYTRDLIDSPIEVAFVPPHDRRLVLLVGVDEITLEGSYPGRHNSFAPSFALTALGVIEETVVEQTHVRPVPGAENQKITVHAGPAVRIAISNHGDWVVSTDRGADVVELVEARKRRAITASAKLPLP